MHENHPHFSPSTSNQDAASPSGQSPAAAWSFFDSRLITTLRPTALTPRPTLRRTRCSTGPSGGFEVTPAHQKLKKEGPLVESGALFAIRADHLKGVVGALAMKEARLAWRLVGYTSRTGHHSFDPGPRSIRRRNHGPHWDRPHRRWVVPVVTRTPPSTASRVPGSLPETCLPDRLQALVFCSLVHVNAQGKGSDGLEPSPQAFPSKDGLGAEVGGLQAFEQCIDHRLRCSDGVRARHRRSRPSGLRRPRRLGGRLPP